MRKSYSAKFKSEVSIEAIKSEKTMAELSAKFEVHRDQIQKWKKKVVQELPELFLNDKRKCNKSNDKLINELYMEIGKLKVEKEWFKKKLQVY